MALIKQYGTLVYSGFNYDENTLQKFNVYQNLTKKLYHSTRRYFQKNSAAFWHRLSYGFERRIQKMLQALDKSNDRDMFASIFYDVQETFLAGVYCYLLSDAGKLVIIGQMFVTNNSLCFFGTKRVAGVKYDLHLILPYEQIQHVVKAGIIRSRGFPSVVPIAEGINPKIIQLYCSDGKLHQLGGFGPAFDKIFRLIVVNGGFNNERQRRILQE